ncbi:unnamed protein product [Symbiodinium sp. CCMP2592]|nr:unnamed protein product [Symbiodinium sp. CCMP2592]
MLLIDCKNRNQVFPTLANMRLNHIILKPFTEAMARYGRISKPVELIKEAVRKFYDSEAEDVPVKPDTMDMKLRREKNIAKSAEAIKSMLTVIKRKWTLWEIPRDEEIRNMVFDLSKASETAYAEGRSALAKSPKQKPIASCGSDDDSDMADDASLRQSLHSSLGERNAESPLEVYLKAPPREELEKMLGFSLDPATYENIRRSKEPLQADRPETGHEKPDSAGPPVMAAPVLDTLEMMQGLSDDSLPAICDVETEHKPPSGDSLPGQTPVKGLAGQLSRMDPARLQQMLAVVNDKLHLVAAVVTRQAQLALTAKKKAKTDAAPGGGKEPGPSEEIETDRVAKPKRGPGRPKKESKKDVKDSMDSKVGPKARATKRKALEEEKEEEKQPCKPKPGVIARKLSKRKLLKKGKKAKAKAKEADNATVYYEYDPNEHVGDGYVAGVEDREPQEDEQEWTKEEWAAWEAEQGAGKRPAKRVRGKQPTPEEEEEEAEPVEEEKEDVPTFARRYFPSRSWYQAKFNAIKDAFNGRIRPFVRFPGKLEDPFWKHVAEALKNTPVENEEDWLPTVSQWTFDFLNDDRVSKTWSDVGEKLFGETGKRPTLKRYEAAIARCAAH